MNEEQTQEPGDVLMPPETLADRLKADGRIYRIGVEAGRAEARAGTFDREKARERLRAHRTMFGGPLLEEDRLLDDLAGCVVADSRLARIAAEVAEAEAEDRICIDTSEIRAILGGGPA